MKLAGRRVGFPLPLGGGGGYDCGMALNPRQQKFVEEYALSSNAADAYRKAGYDCSNAKAASASASRLLSDVSIREAVAALKARLAEKWELTAEWVVNQLREESQRGDPLNTSPSARVKATELLGRIQGVVKDTKTVKGKVKHEHGGQVQVSHDYDLNRLSDAEFEQVERLLSAVRSGNGMAALPAPS